MVSPTRLYPPVPTLTGRTIIRTVLPRADTSTPAETTPEREARQGMSVDGEFTLGTSEC
jgi:hypothetical protein